jgi:Mce-associated membrane protein
VTVEEPAKDDADAAPEPTDATEPSATDLTGAEPTDADATEPTATDLTGAEPTDADAASEPDGETVVVGDDPDAAEESGAGRGRAVVLAALGVLAVALTAIIVHLGMDYQRTRARAAAEAEVLAPAKAAASRILSYDYRHIEQDATAGAGVLTGAFRGQYETVMRQQVVPQAPTQRAVVAAEVLAAGVSGVSPDGKQAFVVVFANQTVSNTATPQPRVDQVRVRLTLDLVDGQWLVSKVDAL